MLSKEERVYRTRQLVLLIVGAVTGLYLLLALLVWGFFDHSSAYPFVKTIDILVIGAIGGILFAGRYGFLFPKWFQDLRLTQSHDFSISAKPTTDECDDPRWPDELGIAVTAWRAACNNAEKDGKRPGAYVREWVQKTYPGRADAFYERIAVVANWDKAPGAGKK